MSKALLKPQLWTKQPEKNLCDKHTYFEKQTAATKIKIKAKNVLDLLSASMKKF